MTDTAWVEGCLRWGQVNLRELEPPRVDVAWWAAYFERTRIHGLTVNAGGIVAYYPTAIPFHSRSSALGDRDVFGELVAVAKQRRLRVLARLDVGKRSLDAEGAHPEWYCRTADGRPVRYLDTDLCYTCINSPYYTEFAAAIMREVHQRYDVDGFFDNGWQSMPRTTGICHCQSCAHKFRADTGRALPERADWGSRSWLEWVQWRYQCLAEAWAFFRETTRACKPGSIYVGNLHRDFADLAAAGVDWLRLGEMADLVGVDLQGRSHRLQLWSPGELGRLMRACVNTPRGPKPYFDLFGQWYAGNPYVRILSKPAAEQQIWLASMTSAGMRPWWHVIGADHTGGDRRWAHDQVIERFFQWHAQTERDHQGLRSAAEVGLVYAPRSIDYYGREDAHRRSVEPYLGWYLALLQTRIPFDLVHERRLDAEDLAPYRLLILPNVACLTDAQLDQLRAFSGRGGSVIATFETGGYDEWGSPRDGFGLSELFGVRWTRRPTGPHAHSYLRIRERHPIVAGFEDTDVLPAESMIYPAVATDGDVRQPLGHIPPFIVLPPELTYPTIPDSGQSMLFLRERGRSRRVYFPNDLDRVFWQANLPDIGRLLGNTIDWALHGDPSVRIDGAGLLDAHTFHAPTGFQLRLANFTNPNLFRMPCTELYPVGPLKVSLRLPEGRSRRARLLRAGEEAEVVMEDGRAHLTIRRITDLEIVAFEMRSPG